MSNQIGFIGAGRMGGRMVRRLLAAGYPVAVCDADPAAVGAAVGRGARAAATPADAARAATVLVCSLPTDDCLHPTAAVRRE